MSADNRTVATDALATLGTIITENEKRDAVHIAVENVIAVHRLAPGDHVRFVPGSLNTVEYTAYEDEVIGVIDPFLADGVMPQQRCWLLKKNCIQKEQSMMPIEEKIKAEILTFWGTDHTLPKGFDKDKYAGEAAMLANQVIRSVERRWQARLNDIVRAIVNPQYGAHGVDIDNIRRDLIVAFMDSLRNG